MKIRRTSYITTLLATGAAAVAIVAAPTALADTGSTAMSCDTTGSGSECQMPGNVQFDDSPPPVNYSPDGGLGSAHWRGWWRCVARRRRSRSLILVAGSWPVEMWLGKFLGTLPSEWPIPARHVHP